MTLKDALAVIEAKGFSRENIAFVREGVDYWMFSIKNLSPVINGMPAPGARDPAVYKDTGEFFYYFPPDHKDYLTAKTYPLPDDLQ